MSIYISICLIHCRWFGVYRHVLFVRSKIRIRALHCIACLKSNADGQINTWSVSEFDCFPDLRSDVGSTDTRFRVRGSLILKCMRTFFRHSGMTQTAEREHVKVWLKAERWVEEAGLEGEIGGLTYRQLFCIHDTHYTQLWNIGTTG